MLDLSMLRGDFAKKESHLNRRIQDIIEKIHGFLQEPSAETVCMAEAWREDFFYLYGNRNSTSSDGSLDEWKLLRIYAVQTCFSLLVKVLMRELLCERFAAKGAGMRKEDAQTDCGSENYRNLVLGTFAGAWGIENYCEEDFYCWPLHELDKGFGKVIGEIEDLLVSYRTELSLAEFMQNSNVDYIRQIYESMIPKGLRHALGEYYTPDWLAERTLQETMKYMDKPLTELRMIDPTCGSGTFLMQAIAVKRQAGCNLKNILSSVCGLDINALAVLTARTNYLLSVLDLLGTTDRVVLPIYRVDVLQLAENSALVEQIGGQADILIGNPPWVNWEYLPEKYRLQSKYLWVEYGLFSARGRERSFSKEDISVLITYIVMDKLLKRSGVIGFVLRQAMFKSAQNGIGFRRFRIRGDCGIQVLQVDDLSRIQVFDNAATSTALFFAHKGADMVYPVPYYVWERDSDTKRCSFGAYSGLKEVLEQLRITRQCAMPAVAEDCTSLWINAPEDKMELMKRVLGSNSYRARTGVFTGGANGVYWFRIHGRNDNSGLVRVSNIVERAKRRVAQADTWLEFQYLFPMIKGSNVRRWNVSYDTYLLCPHTAESRMWPVPGEALRDTCPAAYEYLKSFREELDARKGFAGWEKEIQRQEFHAVLRVGSYTFSKYKVVWKYIATEFVCAVVGEAEDPYLGRKVCLPNEKIMYVSTDDETEAYYLCGILSSSVIADCVKGYMSPTCISAHVLDKLNIPTYDARDERHLEIARLCRQGHGKSQIKPYLDKIDTIVSSMYQTETALPR